MRTEDKLGLAPGQEKIDGVVADFLGGKKAALQFLVGQVMTTSRGKANPGLAAQTLQRLLK